jgi:hypothetical protein
MSKLDMEDYLLHYALARAERLGWVLMITTL